MARNPKPMRQPKRRVQRALMRQGPMTLIFSAPPKDEEEGARMALEDELLMRIVPPTAKRPCNENRAVTPTLSIQHPTRVRV